MNLQTLQVRLVRPDEAERYQALMQAYHYLGSLAKIGETLWYVATYLGEWDALLSFSSAALKCGARDRWIGWNFRHQYSLTDQQQPFFDPAGMALSKFGVKNAFTLPETIVRRLAGAFWSSTLLVTAIKLRIFNFKSTVFSIAYDNSTKR